MTRFPWRRALLLVLTVPAGCLFADGRTLEERKWDPPPEPLAFTLQGVIRDFATMRPEPGAALEFWSDDPGYLPVATVHEDGSYSVLVDLCRRRHYRCDEAPSCQSTAEATAAAVMEPVAAAFLGQDASRCWRKLRGFGVRARLGDRCTFSIEYGGPGWKEREPTLWLHPCRAPERTLYPWRPLPRAPGSIAATPLVAP
jgi:hypothetical protein